MEFFYGQQGRPFAMRYNGKLLHYLLNLQGDVLKLIAEDGTSYGTYNYDAWGKLLYATDNKYTQDNPLRYRSYVYDEETRLYYLQSRYYNPEMGRFINADAFTSTGQGVLGNNMFAYCNNNPIIHADSEGTFFFTVIGAAVGAVVGAVDAWIMGGNAEDIAKAAEAGACAGAIAGAGVDVGVMVVASGGSMGVALGIVAGTGALSGIVGTGVSSDWQAEPSEYLGSAVIAAGLNLLSFGTAPINGEIAKDSIRHMIDNIFFVSSINCPALLENTVYSAIIAEASIWVYRVITGNSE